MRKATRILVLVSGIALHAIHALATELIPHDAMRYRDDLVRQSRLVFGLDAPVALLAAQVHAESSWNPRAISPAGAEGLAQFMPATASWIPTLDSALASKATFTPAWSLRAMARYNHWLYGRLRADTDCDRWAMVLSAYNGGLGWVLRDKQAALDAEDSPWRWWGNVENHNAGRSAAAFSENRRYPRRILLGLSPLYRAAGWGQGVCCGT